MRVRTAITALIVLALVAAACGDGGDAASTDLRIVATTTILGDVVRNIVGDAASIEVLLPIGADPHDFQASSQQVASLLAADLVLANGLDLEEGLEDVLATAADDGANVVEIAPLLDPLPFSGEHEDEDEEDDHGSLDPHVWLDPIRMADAAEVVGNELAAIDPDGGWMATASEYADRLRSVDGEIRSILEAVPAARRKLVTNHDSLGYFADRYEFEVVDAVIPGGATLAEPSSSELADLVAAIERENVAAIFAETTEPTALAEAVAAEAGDIAVVEIFTGSLGEDGSGAETLIEMLLTNARRIAEALR